MGRTVITASYSCQFAVTPFCIVNLQYCYRPRVQGSGFGVQGPGSRVQGRTVSPRPSRIGLVSHLVVLYCIYVINRQATKWSQAPQPDPEQRKRNEKKGPTLHRSGAFTDQHQSHLHSGRFHCNNVRRKTVWGPDLEDKCGCSAEISIDFIYIFSEIQL